MLSPLSREASVGMSFTKATHRLLRQARNLLVTKR
jgi:hypothetical protein